MPTTGSIRHIFPHNWKDVSVANWKKYPTAERPDLVAVDVLNKRVDEPTGCLHVRRLFIFHMTSYPDWMTRLLGVRLAYFIEDTVVDPHGRQLVLTNRNISFSHIMQLEETCTYKPHDDDPHGSTHFQQDGTISATIVGGSSSLVGRYVERYCARRFETNAVKGQKVMHEAIAKVQDKDKN